MRDFPTSDDFQDAVSNVHRKPKGIGRRMKANATGLSLFFFALIAGAQTNIVASPLVAPALPDTGVSLLRVMGALALVLGIFLGGVWLLKNWQRLAARSGRTPRLQVLESRSLGGRHAIYVVGYEQARFLIASSPGGVNFLSHLPPATENETAVAGSIPPGGTFTQALAQAIKGK